MAKKKTKKAKRPRREPPSKLADDGKMKRDEYEPLLVSLQIELLKLQKWVQTKGKKIVILFEGRDAAGKGGTISRIMQHLNPRSARKVALGIPTETERGQWYFQRYVQHLPTSGEIVVFDRSWYNRAGVERVMGFCTEREYEQFMRSAPLFESMLIQNGTTLLKYWLDISREEQARRLEERRTDPLKHWKLGPIDEAAQKKWDQFTQAKQAMFKQTSTLEAPWTVVRSDDKKRLRINCIRHLLHQFEYNNKDKKVATSPDAEIVGNPSNPVFM